MFEWLLIGIKIRKVIILPMEVMLFFAILRIFAIEIIKFSC